MCLCSRVHDMYLCYGMLYECIMLKTACLEHHEREPFSTAMHGGNIYVACKHYENVFIGLDAEY